MPNNILRVVFDCNVFWQIFFSDQGIGSKCWELVVAEKVELLISHHILDELRDVLIRSETQAKFTKANETNVNFFIDEIKENATFVSSVKKSYRLTRDPKDEPYINLAIQENANFIVSRDKDLLDLMIRHDSESKEFRQRFRALKIVDTLTFVGIVENHYKFD